MQYTHMVDIWRNLHPADSIYTCFSSTYIYHMLVFTDLVPYLAAASYVSHSVSDHSNSILEAT